MLLFFIFFYTLLNIICKLLQMPQIVPNYQRRYFILIYMYLQMQLMPRELWVHLLNELFEEEGEFYTLYPDLRHFPTRFFQMYQMSMNKFDRLLAKLSPELSLCTFSYIYSIKCTLWYKSDCTWSAKSSIDSFFSSFTSWEHFPLWPFFGLEWLESCLSSPLPLLLHTDLKWLSLSHFWHFSHMQDNFLYYCFYHNTRMTCYYYLSDFYHDFYLLIYFYLCRLHHKPC